MNRVSSVKWRGREIHSPLARKLIIFSALALAPIILFFGMIVLIFIAIPLAMITDLPLKVLGRKGNFRERNGRWDGRVMLDHNSFKSRKAPETEEPSSILFKIVSGLVFYGGLAALVFWLFWLS